MGRLGYQEHNCQEVAYEGKYLFKLTQFIK